MLFSWKNFRKPRSQRLILPCVLQFSSVQSLSRVRLFVTPWITVRQASLSITNSQSSLRLTSIESVMPPSHLIFYRPLLLLPEPLPASESFPMSQLFAWGDQSTGASALASFQRNPRVDLQNFIIAQTYFFQQSCLILQFFFKFKF